MESALDSLRPGCRVAVVRLRSLGDCVLTTPAVKILKTARPDLRIAVVVERRFRPIFEGNPDIEVLLDPGVSALRKWAPGLCLNLHGGGTSARLTALSGAARRAGFAHFRFPFVYNARIPRAQEILGVERTVHTAEHLASAMFYLGAPRMEIPRARLFAASPCPSSPASPYVVIHPLASHPGKTWPARGFLAVAERLERVVFIAGPGEDLSAFRKYPAVVGAPLGEVKSLLRGATMFVGNDSGPAHMAAAFGLPVVVLFGSSDVAVWRPWKTVCEVLSGEIAGIPERDVMDAVERLRVHA